MTVYRILVRHGLVEPGVRRRKRSDYKRWQRDRAMQLWQMDIVGGVMLVNPVTGELTEAKVVTGVDDHSRYCVIASVVERATGRAVCSAFARALQRFGVPEEVLTDNGKQFTDRFGQGGEVLFDRICRENGIAHRLTQPASPTTTGKVERFHQTLRRELLDDCGAFESVGAAQAALDAWVEEYNSIRPHQALDMQSPADRFTPVAEQDRDVLSLRVPGVLALVPQQRTAPEGPDPAEAVPVPVGLSEEVPPSAAVEQGGPVEFERVVPASGNLQVAGKQFWLGPARSGLTVTFWADTEVIHLLIAGSRIKSVRSHLSVADLGRLAAWGGRAAGPSPLPAGDGAAFEVDGEQPRLGGLGRAPGAGGGDPRRAPGERPYRGGHVVVLRSVLAGAAAGAAQPAHQRGGAAVAGPAARGPAAPAPGGAGAGAAAGQRGGHGHGLPAESFPRPPARRPDHHRARGGVDSHGGAGRPGPRHPAHHRHSRPPCEGGQALQGFRCCLGPPSSISWDQNVKHHLGLDTWLLTLSGPGRCLTPLVSAWLLIVHVVSAYS
jgi:transposase InsO family protein